MFYTLENYNKNTCASIHNYSVEFEPFPYYKNNKVFSRKKDAVTYARNTIQQDETETCKIVLCSFSYIVFHGASAKEFSSKKRAIEYAKRIKKKDPSCLVSVGFYDVTAEDDIVCLNEFEI